MAKRGIIQSRGLGDIIIALPIARAYYEQGDEIIWPICEEFLPSFKDSVPWVTWVPMKTDPQGAYFLSQPLKIFKYHDVPDLNVLYLYQYLNVAPEFTSPELFNILKFDQYKYWVAGVPFVDKWLLDQCITRDPAREAALGLRVGVAPGDRYALTHFKGSTFAVDIKVTWLDPAVRIINMEETLTDNIWDWLGLLEDAEAFVGIDSVFANMVDQLKLAKPTKFWIRRSPWDLTPVLGCQWQLVPTTLPIQEPTRIDPAAEARKKLGTAAPGAQPAAGQVKPSAAGAHMGGLVSHVPFETNKSKYPKSFMHAVKQKPRQPG
jgi:hypothetical protein